MVIDAHLVVGPVPQGVPDLAVAPFAMPPREQCRPARSEIVSLLDHLRVDNDPATDPLVPGEGVVRSWVDLREPEAPDHLFAVLVGDALIPTVHRLGHPGWAPTVQLTALLHTVPAPGALAAQSTIGEIRDGWFDEETAVVDATGRLVSRVRQLARLPR